MSKKLNIIFFSGMTFHYRSLLPIMKRLVEENHSIYVFGRGKYSAKNIGKTPRAFNVVTKLSLEFIAEQSGLNKSFISKIIFIRPRLMLGMKNTTLNEMDAFVSTTKSFPWLNKVNAFEKPRIAVAYQNCLGTYYTSCNDWFPPDCPSDIGFEAKMRKTYNLNYIESGSPFMDSYSKRAPTNSCSIINNKVLLLHPGGYRDVITNHGTSKIDSIKKQKSLYINILKHIPEKIKMDIKIHPLAAKYHDYQTNEKYLSDLGIEFIEGFLGDQIFNYDAVLSIGSSAIFEVLPFKPLWIINFLSQERTKHYTDFSSLLINSGEELFKKLDSNSLNCYSNQFEEDFITRLKNISDGCSVEKITTKLKEFVKGALK